MSLVTRAAMMGALTGYNAYQRNRSMVPRLRATYRSMTRKRSNMGALRRMQRMRPKRASRRNWKARARRQVGNPRNFSTAKTTESVNPGTTSIGPGQGDFLGPRALTTKTIASSPLIIIQGTSVNNINARQRDMCVVSGVKINASFKNETGVRLYVNWAVVHGKQGQNISAATTDFFRDYNQNRTFDASHNGKTGLTSSVAQINTDEFVVMARGKFMLTPVQTASAAIGAYNYGGQTKEKSLYVKLGRSFYFDDSADEPQDQIYFVVWAADPLQAVAVSTDGALGYKLRSITYWREPRGA